MKKFSYTDHCLLFMQDAPMSGSVKGVTLPLAPGIEKIENGSLHGSEPAVLDVAAGEKLLLRRTPAPSKHIKDRAAEAAAEEDQTRTNKPLSKIGMSTKADLN
jgi:hypothetical protein